MPLATLPTALLFDLDGTLVDTNRLNRSAWRQAVRERGLELDDELYARIVGTHVEFVRDVFAKTYGEHIAFDEILERRLALAAETRKRDGIAPMPGAREILEWASAHGIRCAVGTTTERAIALDILDRASFLGFIEHVVGGDEVVLKKPAPDIYLECANRLNIPAERCLVVEDTDAGARAGEAAGMPFVIVPDLSQPLPETVARAAGLYSSLRDLQRDLSRFVC